MSLMDIYNRVYGAGAEKVASGKEDDPQQLLADLMKTASKSPEDDKNEKLAAAYDQLGRRLAQETFVNEVMGGQEKDASILKEIIDGQKEAAAEETSEETTEETTEEQPAKEADDKEFLAGLAAILNGDGKPAAEEKTAEEKKAEEKQAALNELAEKVIEKAASGDARSKAALKYMVEKAAAGKGKAVLEALRKGYKAVKGKKGTKGRAARVGAAAGAGGGALAGYLAGRSGKEKK